MIGKTFNEFTEIVNGQYLSQGKPHKVNAQVDQVGFPHCFSDDISKTGPCTLAKHSIDTGDSKPISKRGYQVPYHWHKKIEEEIKRGLEKGILRHSNSEWASGIVPIRKKDGSLRLRIDFRPLNDVTVKDRYPLPRIDEILDCFSGAAIFSTLDATSGYHQFKLQEEDKKKTAFRFNGGFYEYNRMPFGLCNTPSKFQRAMDGLFAKEYRKYVIPYLDDVIIFSKSKEEHAKHVKVVLEKLAECRLTLNPKKSRMFIEEIEILGRVVSKGVVKPCKEKVETVRTFKKPENIKELRSFLGLISFCREFIPKASQMAGPLFKLLEGETKRSIRKISWSSELEDAFYQLRVSLSDETLRFQPDLSREFTLTTDASEFAIGGMLSQQDGSGKDRLVHKFSKRIEKAQMNYSVTEKELLAVIFGLEKFRKYLLGRKFKLRTDHKALSTLNKTENLSGRLMRWSLKIYDYDFDVEYIKGENNYADGLSRNTQETQRKINRLEVIEMTSDERNDLIMKYHCESGHSSYESTRFLLNGKVRGPNSEEAIKNLVLNCEICLKGSRGLPNTVTRRISAQRFGEVAECT